MSLKLSVRIVKDKKLKTREHVGEKFSTRGTRTIIIYKDITQRLREECNNGCILITIHGVRSNSNIYAPCSKLTSSIAMMHGHITQHPKWHVEPIWR